MEADRGLDKKQQESSFIEGSQLLDSHKNTRGQEIVSKWLQMGLKVRSIYLFIKKKTNSINVPHASVSKDDGIRFRRLDLRGANVLQLHTDATLKACSRPPDSIVHMQNLSYALDQHALVIVATVCPIMPCMSPVCRAVRLRLVSECVRV